MTIWQERIKRTVDVAVAAAGLAILGPLLAAVSLAIWSVLGRPVFFKQRRPGLGGGPFTLIKFRTMRQPRPGDDLAATDAQRLTRLGRLLRRTSLDELPTLWNVLRGDMSLVGPRPLLVDYLDRYTPEQRRRHEVKPGVTGWAQIHGRNAISWEEKFRLDVWYVDHRSFRLDVHILVRTLLSVLRCEGISAAEHPTMPEFLPTRQNTSRTSRDTIRETVGG